MTVRLADERISELEQEGRIIACERLVCTVCGQVVHDRPNRGDKQGGRFRCPRQPFSDHRLRMVDQHWHAADGAGPVSQYAVTS